MWLFVFLNLIVAGLVVKFALDIVLAVWCNAVYGVPYVPTRSKLIRQTVKLLSCQTGQRVIDLGSGDGRVLIEFDREYEIKGIGYERNRLLLWMANLRWKFTWPKRGKINFVNDDLFKVSFKNVDVVYMYLVPWMIERLRAGLERELKPGARVVSFDYPLNSSKFQLEKMIGKGKQKVAVYRRINI